VDPGSYPSPYIEGLLRPSRGDVLFEWARGCIYRCHYCSWNSTMGRQRVRYKNLAAVEREIRWASERGYREGVIVDAALNFDTPRLERLSALLGELRAPEGMSFTYELHPACFDEAQLPALERIPSLEVCLALESTNERALRAAGRKSLAGAAFLDIATKLSTVCRVVALVMLGMPGDTLEGWKRTIEFLVTNAVRDGRQVIHKIYPSWMVVPHGSYFFRRRERYGLRLASPGIPYVLGSTMFPEADMAAAIRYLHDRPPESMVGWMDAPVGLYFPELSGLRFGGGGQREVHDS
jgi:radical SAM superfamily enzyme YgiQ (UPF0313 family)